MLERRLTQSLRLSLIEASIENGEDLRRPTSPNWSPGGHEELTNRRKTRAVDEAELRFRIRRAEKAEFELEKLKGTLLPVDELKGTFNAWRVQLRGVNETVRQASPEAYELLCDELDEVEGAFEGE